MALTSPGSQITIIDESQYLPAAAGPRPLIIAASSQNKVNASGSGIATGTLASNAGKVQLVTSQRELTTLFGVPNFVVENGAVLQGSELNEYGLLAAYSFLGVASGAYVLRPDVDLAQLTASGSVPTGEVETGQYWLDLAQTSWGLLEWNAVDQAFSVIAPHLLTSADDLSSGAPKPNLGRAGDYAITLATGTLRAFYKGARSDRSQNWVQLGSDSWKTAHPTIVMNTDGGFADNVLQLREAGVGSYETINSGTDPESLVLEINSNPTISVFATAVQTGNTVTIYSERDLEVGAGSNATLLLELGLTAKVYYAPKLHQAPHTVVPGFKTGSAEPRPTGSVWFKTTSPNSGTNIVLKRMSAAGEWIAVTVPLYSGGSAPTYDDNDAANAALSSDGVNASTIPNNSVYMRYNELGTNVWQSSLLKWTSIVPLRVNGSTANPAINIGDSFTVRVSGVEYTVEVTSPYDTSDAEGLANAFGRTNIPFMSMVVNTDGTVSVLNSQARDFLLTDGNGSPLSACGISAGVYSNWDSLGYTASTAEPRDPPADGTLWYNSNTADVDILVHNGSAWVGYRNEFFQTDPAGPFVGATEPEEQSDGTELVANDLWIDTSDLENYPVIKRYTGAGSWETLDNTDQTTENGVLFADARYRAGSTGEDSSEIKNLLVSNYLDLDAPDGAMYPKGILLFNLRRSGYNVKEFRSNYFNATDFPSMSLPSYTDAWVSKVSTDSQGRPYMGRKAQRRVIVAAMQAALSASLEARQEQNDFNLIAAPGYPELADEMISLNSDRKGTAFVLVDPPFRLKPTGSAVRAWALNSNGAVSNGEEGLTNLNEYSAVYYPNGYATELRGNDVMVPASHIMLRTIALNDQVAFPWFAPAGLRRGIVNNATSVGYLSDEGEFVPAPLGQGERDVMYESRVNPIVIQPSGGIVVWGQKTLSATSSALDRVNVARLVVYVRSQLDRLVKPYLFEPNDTLTRNEVKQSIESFFNELVGQRALYDFLVVCDESNNTPERIDRNELWVDIAIKPVKAIEFIYVPIRIKNTGEALA